MTNVKVSFCGEIVIRVGHKCQGDEIHTRRLQNNIGSNNAIAAVNLDTGEHLYPGQKHLHESTTTALECLTKTATEFGSNGEDGHPTTVPIGSIDFGIEQFDFIENLMGLDSLGQ